MAATASFLLSFILASVTAGWSSPSETAKTAFEQKDYATALRIWRPLADGGDVDAQLGVAVIYADGLGVSRDYVLAARWFLAAALKGSAPQFNLATMHFDGQGVPQSYAEAVRWFRRAADQGHAGAQYNLRNLYAEGRGIARDSGVPCSCIGWQPGRNIPRRRLPLRLVT